MLELLWFAVTVGLWGYFPNLPWYIKAIMILNLIPQTYLLIVKANRRLEDRQMEREFMQAATKVEADYVPGQEDMDAVFATMEKQGQTDQQVRGRLVHMYGDRVGEQVFQRWLASGRQIKLDDLAGMGHAENMGVD